MHGGGPAVTAGKPLDHAYKGENLDLVTKGTCNLERHIKNAGKYGVPVVVALNRFASDTQAELDIIIKASKDAGEHLEVLQQCGIHTKSDMNRLKKEKLHESIRKGHLWLRQP